LLGDLMDEIKEATVSGETPYEVPSDVGSIQKESPAKVI